MILITGGTGYLGSRLAHYLLAFGHEVIVASRYKKKKFPYLKDFRFVNFDLQNKEVLKQCLKNVDTVFHLADLNAQNSYLNPQNAIAINGKGTLNLLETDTKYLQVLDSSGNDRTKSGFFVDAFKDHSGAEMTNLFEYRASTDFDIKLNDSSFEIISL